MTPEQELREALQLETAAAWRALSDSPERLVALMRRCLNSPDGLALILSPEEVILCGVTCSLVLGELDRRRARQENKT